VNYSDPHPTAWGKGYQDGLRGKPENGTGFGKDLAAVYAGGYLAGLKTRTQSHQRLNAAFEQSLNRLDEVLEIGTQPAQVKGGRRKKSWAQRLGLRP
jgi:hypothetical protein